MKNREKVIEVLTHKFGIWKKGKMERSKAEGTTELVGILEQEMCDKTWAEHVVEIIEAVDAEEAKKLLEV
jgi:hypothetical protein